MFKIFIHQKYGKNKNEYYSETNLFLFKNLFKVLIELHSKHEQNIIWGLYHSLGDRKK